ncbi:MAG: hypothetical protein LBN74_03825 [Prevotella sp.]|jgi:hypothetical protein|nr:hypothetical protein [Prevotella sp.]
MRILSIIFASFFILYFGTFLRYLYKKYFKKEEGITFNKLLFNGKRSKNKEYEFEDFENDMSNKAWGCSFLIILILLLVFLSKSGLI